jgi:hypothetical protein
MWLKWVSGRTESNMPTGQIPSSEIALEIPNIYKNRRFITPFTRAPSGPYPERHESSSYPHSSCSSKNSFLSRFMRY